MAVDIGNSNITLGAMDEGVLIGSWRFAPDPRKTAEEYSLLISGLLAMDDFEVSSFEAAIICSVVPDMTRILRTAIIRLISLEPLLVNSGVRTGIRVSYDRVQDVGPDRIADAVAVKDLYGCPAIIIDVGTALVLNAINKDCEYIGGAIAPGLKMSADSLYTNTAMLRRVEIEAPPTAIGRSTSAAIQSGLIYGFSEIIEGMVKRFKRELSLKRNSHCKVIGTGGMVHILAPYTPCFDEINVDLTIYGLGIIYKMNVGR